VPPTLLDDVEAVSGAEHIFRTLFGHKPTLVDLDRRVELLDRFDVDVNVLVPLPRFDTVPALAVDPEHRAPPSSSAPVAQLASSGGRTRLRAGS
jgi:hypothetical protein